MASASQIPPYIPINVESAIEQGEKELSEIIGRMPQRCRQRAESLRQQGVAQIRSQAQALAKQNLVSEAFLCKMNQLVDKSFKHLQGALGRLTEKCILYNNQKESARRSWDLLEEQSDLDLLEMPPYPDDCLADSHATCTPPSNFALASTLETLNRAAAPVKTLLKKTCEQTAVSRYVCYSAENLVSGVADAVAVTGLPAMAQEAVVSGLESCGVPRELTVETEANILSVAGVLPIGKIAGKVLQRFCLPSGSKLLPPKVEILPKQMAPHSPIITAAFESQQKSIVPIASPSVQQFDSSLFYQFPKTHLEFLNGQLGAISVL